MDFREIVEFLKDCAVYIIIILVVFLFFTFGFSIQKVVGNSMNPTYENNEIVLLSKIGAKITKIKRNDIIAFNTDSGVTYIKRVMAGPGDTIYAKDNQVYINGIAIEEEYLTTDQVTDNFKFENICNVGGCEENKIPDNYYFVMGDNRIFSIVSHNKIVIIWYFIFFTASNITNIFKLKVISYLISC